MILLAWFKAFEDRSLLPLIVLFMSHTGKNGEQCPRRLENAQYADICLPWTRCSGHHHWGNPSAYWSWKSGQGMLSASGDDICSEPAVSTTTLQNIWGVPKTFCGTWHTAPKAFLPIHDTKKQTSELVGQMPASHS